MKASNSQSIQINFLNFFYTINQSFPQYLIKCSDCYFDQSFEHILRTGGRFCSISLDNDQNIYCNEIHSLNCLLQPHFVSGLGGEAISHQTSFSRRFRCSTDVGDPRQQHQRSCAPPHPYPCSYPCNAYSSSWYMSAFEIWLSPPYHHCRPIVVIKPIITQQECPMVVINPLSPCDTFLNPIVVTQSPCDTFLNPIVVTQSPCDTFLNSPCDSYVLSPCDRSRPNVHQHHCNQLSRIERWHT